MSFEDQEILQAFIEESVTWPTLNSPCAVTESGLFKKYTFLSKNTGFSVLTKCYAAPYTGK